LAAGQEYAFLPAIPWFLVGNVPPLVTEKIRRAFHDNLMAWYDANRRDLPWRRTRDPYAIVVSEYMLQQTQVATVIPYYLRWLDAFPDWAALARAGESGVLKSWEGLGYYRRARFLHQLAKHVAGPLGGQLPRDAAALRELPGIGPYMAGAVASIAFGRKTPLVDGNVERVFARVFALSDPTGQTATKKKMWDIAEKLLPAERCGDFNQALMELGATVCTPRNPRCLLCPLEKACQAGDPHNFPVKRKTASIVSDRTYAAVIKGGKIRLLKASTPGLWKGLPRLPEWDGTWMKPGRPCGKLALGITVHRIRATVVCASPSGPAPADGEWIPLASLKSLTLPAPHRRMIQMALMDP